MTSSFKTAFVSPNFRPPQRPGAASQPKAAEPEAAEPQAASQPQAAEQEGSGSARSKARYPPSASGSAGARSKSGLVPPKRFPPVPEFVDPEVGAAGPLDPAQQAALQQGDASAAISVRCVRARLAQRDCIATQSCVSFVSMALSRVTDPRFRMLRCRSPSSGRRLRQAALVALGPLVSSTPSSARAPRLCAALCA